VVQEGDRTSHAGDAETVWRATGLERPVFLDERGRRARLVRLGGALAALLVTAWLGLVVAGPVGFTRLPRVVTAPIVHQLHFASVLRRTQDRDGTRVAIKEVKSHEAVRHPGTRTRS
jgi:hypothetical protein